MPISEAKLPVVNGFVEVEDENGDRLYQNVESSELYTPDLKLVDLPAEIDRRVQKSKADLSIYLENHPMQWTDGEHYSITAEKQNQLTSKIMAATMAQTMSADYTLTWNSTGEVCKEWALTDLYALAFAIDARVTALVSYQQTQEVAMKNAATLDELNAIEVNYDSVQ